MYLQRAIAVAHSLDLFDARLSLYVSDGVFCSSERHRSTGHTPGLSVNASTLSSSIVQPPSMQLTNPSSAEKSESLLFGIPRFFFFSLDWRQAKATVCRPTYSIQPLSYYSLFDPSGRTNKSDRSSVDCHRFSGHTHLSISVMISYSCFVPFSGAFACRRLFLKNGSTLSYIRLICWFACSVTIGNHEMMLSSASTRTNENEFSPVR